MAHVRRLLSLIAATVFFVMATPGALAGMTDLTLTTLDGKALDLATLKPKAVLFVNVASFCGFTPQYGGLQALQDRYKARGLLIVGVPCNQFGEQEPGSATEIQNFCSTRYGVSFPLLTKQDVNGPRRSPLYAWLVGSNVGASKDVAWNFEKFLVSGDGRVLGRFASHVIPEDPTLITAIEVALGP